MLDNVLWLTNTPAGDINFRSTLERASLAEIQAAIRIVETQSINKTKLTALNRAARKRERDGMKHG